MFELKVLIGKRLGAVNCRAPSPIAIQKVASLDHELLDLNLISSDLSQTQ